MVSEMRNGLIKDAPEKGFDDGGCTYIFVQVTSYCFIQGKRKITEPSPWDLNKKAAVTHGHLS